MEKLPPIEKVYEAWTALADARVQVQGDTATVESSDGAKSYTIQYDPAGDTYASNDNSTFWRGYAGYPVIAFMMYQGRLPFDAAYAELWKGVNWKALNTKYKNRYAEAVAEVEKERGIDPEEALSQAGQVMIALRSLPASTKRLVKKKA